MKGNMEDCSDGHLVEQAKQGDVEAFAELARRCQEKVYYTLLALTKNQQDASDLAQEAFMQAFKSLKSFKQRSSFYTWIYRIAVNLTLNFLKRRKREEGREVLNESHFSIFVQFILSPSKIRLQSGLKHFPGFVHPPGYGVLRASQNSCSLAVGHSLENDQCERCPIRQRQGIYGLLEFF